MNAAKTALRADRRAARAARSGADTAAAGRRLVAHLLAGLNERGTRTVAGYVPVGSEPGAGSGDELVLPAAVAAAGIGLLLPVFRPDRDLDWAWYAGPERLVCTARGLWEPRPGDELGRAALADADLVVVPALAVSASGERLGRGAGCYDRALTRVPDGVPIVALVYDDDLLTAVPAENHDRRVTDVITPSGGWQQISAYPQVSDCERIDSPDRLA